MDPVERDTARRGQSVRQPALIFGGSSPGSATQRLRLPLALRLVNCARSRDRRRGTAQPPCAQEKPGRPGDADRERAAGKPTRDGCDRS